MLRLGRDLGKPSIRYLSCVVISVVRLNVTPVKGLALSHPGEVLLTPIGVPENRRFFMADPNGALVSAERFGPMQQVHADLDTVEDRLTLTFPDGTVVSGNASAGGSAVSTDFYGRLVPAHVVPGPFAAALSDYTGLSVRLVRTDAPGDGSDVHHLTLVSRASVAELGRAGGASGDIDAGRFRMLLELDGCRPYEEDTWDGRFLRVGAATVRVCGQVPRCVITTQSPKTGLKDFDTLKVLATSRGRMAGGAGLPFGMYGEVEHPGSVRVGDPVNLLP
ncbi:MAG: uncharacterized protein QOI81_490 [Actinomycetota bacterium]|nr:uncharacterized protein [Actinomycetota bacterium]